MKRIFLPLAAGIVAFGGVTAFAATLNVSGKTVGSGSATAASCNATASVSFNTAYASAVPGYKVTTAPVTTAVSCATLAYKVTLTGTGSSALGEITGVLDATGAASPDFSSLGIAAANVTGVSVLITG